MLNTDLSPFYRSTIGFDRLLSMLDKVAGGEPNAPTYPPYNIERTGENAYRITVAVAGFAESELSVETKENTLTIRGAKEAAKTEDKRDVRLSGHRRPRLRAPFPACRSCGGDRRDERKRTPAHRPRTRGAGNPEAAHDRDQRRQDDRSQSGRPESRVKRRRGDEFRQAIPGAPFKGARSCVSPLTRAARPAGR